MSYEYILYEERGPVGIITYNRPAMRNAWNAGIVRETIDAIKKINDNYAIGAWVLTGAGSVYCAGADIKSPPEPKDEKGFRPTAATLSMGKGDHNWIDLLEKSKPNIIAVNGPAIGIGVTHILSGDIRMAAASATFSFPFLKLGAMPEAGSTALLAKLVGFGRAVDLCFASAKIDATEAKQIGLISSIHPDGELLDAAVARAAQMAAYQPLQMKLTKQMLYENAGERSSDEILRRENGAFIELLRTLKRSKTL
jgi:enoyl-CoA hydratase/carnithine racemase